MNKYVLAMIILFPFFCACIRQSKAENIDLDPTETCIKSDDGNIEVYWHESSDGGTAPVIESICKFRSQNGDIKEEDRPLLSIVHPNEDYMHHEVSRIVTYSSEYGETVYFFFLRAKVGSNEFSHDIISMIIEGDSLKPIDIMNKGEYNTSHISLSFD